MRGAAFQSYLDEVQQRIEEGRQQAEGRVSAAADLIAESIARGRVLYVFGPSHAGLMAQDLFYRAGGLLAIEPLLPEGLMLNHCPVTRTSELERQTGYAVEIIKNSTISADDVLLIVSVSGRNPVVTELCTLAQARGARVIALTSLAYSRSVQPRARSARLFELADIIIDLPGLPGDAAVALDGIAQRVGPTSTAVGSAILQGLMVEVSARLLENGIRPPVLVSANLDHGDEWNQQLFEIYRSRVSYL